MTPSQKRAIVAIALLVLGVVWQALGRTPPVDIGIFPILKLTKDGQIDVKFMQDRMAFARRKVDYIRALEPPYASYPNAFVIAQSEADYAKIKAGIDRELAAKAAVTEQGLGAVPGLTGTALTRPPLWLVALAAAIAFQSFAFVMGGALVGGVIFGGAETMNTLTGLTNEHFLGSILAALIVAAAGWLVLQRFARPPPPP